MIMLGIETSCDETAAAVVQDSINPSARILSNVVQSQHVEHRPFGGIVPEIAARSHLQRVDQVINAAMSDAAVEFGDLDGVAATGGPGLIGGVIVGVTSAKGIALARDIPFIARVHIAPQGNNPQVRPGNKNLGFAAERGCAKSCAFRQIVKRLIFCGNKSVPDVFARHDGVQGDVLG